MKAGFHLKIEPELRERLDKLQERLQIRIKRDGSHRPAKFTELLTLGAELLAHHLETGEDALSGSRSFHGAKQQVVNSAGRVTGVIHAPLVSMEVYAEIAANPRELLESELELLDTDAALLELDLDVFIRGSFFTLRDDPAADPLPVGKVARIVHRRGRAGTQVRVPGRAEPFPVHPYDLIPAEMAPSNLD